MKNLMEYTATIQTERKLNIHEIEGTDFAFYEDVREIDTDGKKEIKTYTGVTSIKNLQETKELERVNRYVHAPKMYEEKAYVVPIKKMDFDLVLKGNRHITTVIGESTAIGYPLPEDTILALWNCGSYTIADLNYNFISIPIRFDYIDGGTDNSKFNLRKLMKKLKADENVVNKEQLCIKNIPYYNSDVGRDKFIEFQYLLPQDIYEKVIQMNCFERNNYILKNVICANDCLKKGCEL